MNFNEDYRMTINGELVAGEATIDVVNPATGQPFATGITATSYRVIVSRL